MRILGFLLSAAVLHVVVLAFTPNDSSQNADEFLVGVALVQRQMDPLAATTPADPPGEEQKLPAAHSTEHSPAAQSAKVNVPEGQEDVAEPLAQELPVETKHNTLKADEELSDLVEEVPIQPVQPPQPPLEPDADNRPAEMSASSAEPVNPPSLDQPPVVTKTLSRSQRPPAEQGAVVPAAPQAVEGVPDARKPSISQVAAQPRYGYHPAPTYPAIARRRGWEGTVEYNVRVLANGEVGEMTLKSTSGYKHLDDAARRAIKRWHFTPASRAGKVVESWVVVPVHFVLDAPTRSR